MTGRRQCPGALGVLTRPSPAYPVKCSKTPETPLTVDGVTDSDNNNIHTRRNTEMNTDPRVIDLWAARDFVKDNPTSVIKNRVRRLERELQDEGIDIETRPAPAAITRWVIFTTNGRHDLGGTQVTHADRHCSVCEQYPGFVDEATDAEIARLRRCGLCG